MDDLLAGLVIQDDGAMNHIDWNPIVNSVGLLIGALTLAIPGIMAWLSSKRVEATQASTAAKADTIIEKADSIKETTIKIHEVANSAVALAKADAQQAEAVAAVVIEGLKAHVKQLIEQLAEKRQDAALKQQSDATVAVVAPIAAKVELITPTSEKEP